MHAWQDHALVLNMKRPGKVSPARGQWPAPLQLAYGLLSGAPAPSARHVSLADLGAWPRGPGRALWWLGCGAESRWVRFCRTRSDTHTFWGRFPQDHVDHGGDGTPYCVITTFSAHFMKRRTVGLQNRVQGTANAVSSVLPLFLLNTSGAVCQPRLDSGPITSQGGST